MADNTARIAEIRTLLANGAKSVSQDGNSVQYDFDELRRELRRLQATDDATGNKRPVVSSIKLGSF